MKKRQLFVMRWFMRSLVSIVRDFEIRHYKRAPKGMGEPGRAVFGFVDHENKRIFIKKTAVSVDLDTVVHELLHAMLPSVDEERITSLTDKMIRWMWDGAHSDVWDEIWSLVTPEKV